MFRLLQKNVATPIYLDFLERLEKDQTPEEIIRNDKIEEEIEVMR